jgi:hypothetical protein
MAVPLLRDQRSGGPIRPRASGASDQRIFILRRHRMTVALANETDHAMDLPALNRVIATAIATLT